MNQPMSFVWDASAAELAKKAGTSSGINETGAYEGVITSAVYVFGRDGSQSQALELSFDSNGSKANYLKINYMGKDGSPTFAMGLVSALMWAAQVKQLQPQQVNLNDGSVEWQCPNLVGKNIGLFLQKILYTKNDRTDGYRFEIRHIFQSGSRKTYAEHSDNKPAEAITALENTLKDKGERNNHSHGHAQSSQRQPVNPYGQARDVPLSRLQAANQSASNAFNPDEFDDDIPF
ncbi:hypothetical protein [Plesiomonas sp.]|uniref:hypothetical protein n=1 Tax=Plesiomonas sp. TaxID=2486279 RepID=UPI003F3AB31C